MRIDREKVNFWCKAAGTRGVQAKGVTVGLDTGGGKPYVVKPRSDSNTVLDNETLRIRGTIPVGKRPCAVVIVAVTHDRLATRCLNFGPISVSHEP